MFRTFYNCRIKLCMYGYILNSHNIIDMYNKYSLNLINFKDKFKSQSSVPTLNIV